MNQMALENTKKLKLKAAIIALTIMSLAFRTMYLISYNLYLKEFTKISGIAIIAISIFLQFVPVLLLLIYSMGCFEKRKATVIIPMIFVSMLLFEILSIASYIASMYSYRENSLPSEYVYIGILISAVFIGLDIMAMVGSFRGFKPKAFLIIPISLLLSYTLLELATRIYSFITNLHSYPSLSMRFWKLGAISDLLSYIATILFLVALLLFVLKNKIPSIVGRKSKEKNSEVKALTIEEELKFLIYQYELGIITEEEYKAQRAEIISKL